MAVLDSNFDQVLCISDAPVKSYAIHLWMLVDLTRFARMMSLGTLLDRHCQGLRSILVWKNMIQ